MVMEKLIVLGARMVLLFGYCGSLQSDVRIGDLFVPTDAVSGEGTSQYYKENLARSVNKLINEWGKKNILD